MCKFASFVLTRHKEFWLDTLDSHSDIIREFKLHEDGAGGPNILRVELTPPCDGDLGDFSRWEYRVDQDILPSWADRDADEKRSRNALVRRAKDGLKTNTLNLNGCTDRASGDSVLCIGHKIQAVEFQIAQWQQANEHRTGRRL